MGGAIKRRCCLLNRLPLTENDFCQVARSFVNKSNRLLCCKEADAVVRVRVRPVVVIRVEQARIRAIVRVTTHVEPSLSQSPFGLLTR